MVGLRLTDCDEDDDAVVPVVTVVAVVAVVAVVTVVATVTVDFEVRTTAATPPTAIMITMIITTPMVAPLLIACLNLEDRLESMTLRFDFSLKRVVTNETRNLRDEIH